MESERLFSFGASALAAVFEEGSAEAGAEEKDEASARTRVARPIQRDGRIEFLSEGPQIRRESIWQA